MDHTPSLSEKLLKGPVATTPSRFLTLSGELRNIVYAAVFADIEKQTALSFTKSKRSIRKKIQDKMMRYKKRASTLSLLFTCKQIHSEAFRYVHGIIHAEYSSPDDIESCATIRRVFKQVAFNSTAKQIHRCFDVNGPNMQHVTNLDVRGFDALELLQPPNTFGTLTRHVSSDSVLGRHRASMNAALQRIHTSLPNVRHLTVFLEPEAESWLFQQLLFTEGYLGGLQVAFPRVDRFDVVGSTGTNTFTMYPLAAVHEGGNEGQNEC